MRRRAALRALPVLTVMAAFAMAAVAPGASAHPADPTVRTLIDAVEPPADGVTIQVVENVAAQLVVENPTDEVLAVLDDDGQAFLRIGPGGVEANLTSPHFWLSNSPSGGVSVPDDAVPGAPPRWARVATDPSWGWYDHRLHPEAQAVPVDVVERDEAATLAEWVVPLELGGRRTEVRGRLEFTPVRGQVVSRLVQLGTELPGVVTQLAPGRVPAMYVANQSSDPVVVSGADGEPFARIGPGGAEVNRHSPLWIENARANDQDVSTLVADPSAPPDWAVVSSSPSLTWLEPRAAYPDLEPPADVVAAEQRTVLTEWSIALEQGDVTTELTGETAWEPIASAAGERGGSGDDSPDAWLLVLAVLAPVVLVAGAFALRARR